MIYFANPCGEPIVLNAMRTGFLGYIDTPRQGNARPPGTVWCADNGCFGVGYPGDDGFVSWLDTLPERELCRFAVAPDVVSDAAATLARSRPLFPIIRKLGYPVAMAAQNGLTPDAVPWDELDAIFIGGDTSWKLGSEARDIAAEAKRRGKWLHMGRVNSRRRLRYAYGIGCDSVDGTFLVFGPRVNFFRLQPWLHEINDSLDLGVFA